MWLRKALDGAFGEIPARELELALLRACDYGHLECARLLLKHGVPLDCRDVFKECPLNRAVNRDHVGIVEMLLDGAFGEIPARDMEWALLRACDYGHLECARLLLKHGVRLDCRDSFDECPLTLAAKHGHVGIVELLLEAGADVNSTNYCGCSPIMEASVGQPFGVVNILVNHHAIFCTEQLARKLNYRPDRTDHNNRQSSALDCAIVVDNVELVRTLLAADACVFDLKPGKRTALHTAMFYARTQIVQMLLEAGADIDNLDCDGNSPISIAIARHNHPAIKALICGNCRLDIRCPVFPRGTVVSVFYLAMWIKDVETMEILYQAGACTNAVLSECVNSEVLRKECSDAPEVYERLKHYMSQVRYLSTFGGADVREMVDRFLKETVSNEAPKLYSMKGLKGKRKFENLPLLNVL